MIKGRNIAPGTIGLDKLAFPNFISGKHTDASLPQVIWIAKGGADSLSSAQGSRDEPYLTLEGVNGAARAAVDGRGDRFIIGPGTYRANWDFGSGTGTTGPAGRMNKRDVGIFGSGGAHPGRTQIVSDGTTVGPTIRVRDGYLRGFILADLEVGSVTTADVDRAQPLMDLETDDTAVLTATSSDEFAVLRNVRFASDGTATLGLVLTGTQQLYTYDLVFAGIIRALAFRGSLDNFPDHCEFHNARFYDNTTADITTLSAPAQGSWTGPVRGAVNLTNILFYEPKFLDRGGTPVTNFIDIVGTHVNVGFYEFVSARDVADGTLMELAADDIAIGRSAAAAEFVIGA